MIQVVVIRVKICFTITSQTDIVTLSIDRWFHDSTRTAFHGTTWSGPDSLLIVFMLEIFFVEIIIIRRFRTAD